MKGTEILENDPPGSDILANLPAILWQRRWLFAIPLVLCAIAGVAAALFLPRVYQSRAVLLVESQNLPMDGNDNPATELIDRRIAKIRQQILSRPDLVGLIQANDLYDASNRAEPLSVLVERMRAATNISAVDANISRAGGGQASIAFALAFEYPSAPQAQLVAQAFVDRLLKLDASESLSQAESNVRFLQDQQETLQAQINQIEGEINRITGTNGMALANAGGGALLLGGGGGGYEAQIAGLQRDNAQLSAQLGRSAIDPGVAAAEAQLTSLRAIFADDHPDVRAAQSRVAAARRVAQGNSNNAGDASIRQQIASNNALIAQMNSARASDASRTAALMAAQARGPAVLQQVNQLQSRVESLRMNLGRVNSNLINAQSVAKLATEQRGERLTLVDPPVTPDEPTSPNRVLLAGGGVALGLIVGLGMVLASELIMQPIRSVSALSRLTGQPPLGVVPILDSKIGRAHRRKRRLRDRLPSLRPRLPFRRRPAPDSEAA